MKRRLEWSRVCDLRMRKPLWVKVRYDLRRSRFLIYEAFRTAHHDFYSSDDHIYVREIKKFRRSLVRNNRGTYNVQLKLRTVASQVRWRSISLCSFGIASCHDSPKLVRDCRRAASTLGLLYDNGIFKKARENSCIKIKINTIVLCNRIIK